MTLEFIGFYDPPPLNASTADLVEAIRGIDELIGRFGDGSGPWSERRLMVEELRHRGVEVSDPPGVRRDGDAV
jgi:hypothetical protein